MKKMMFTAMALSTILASCSPKEESTSNVESKNKMVLAAFNDMTTPSSFNEDGLAGLPSVVSFSENMTPAKNQGQRGTCTFFAATALVEAAIKIDMGIETNLSEEYMMYSTKSQGHYDDVEASHISVNLQSLKTGGMVLEKDWSYLPSFFGEGKPCSGLDANGDETSIDCFVHTPTRETLQKVIPASAIKTGFIRKNTNEIIKFLAKNKRPLAISLPVNFSGWRSSGYVYYTEELRQQCLDKPSECGAHSVLLTGYNLEEKVFYFKNSWGTDWGDNGFGTLTFEMVDRYVDGYLYYAKVEGEISLPEDHDNEEVSLNVIKTEVSADMNVTVDLEIKNGSGRYIEVQHYLAYIYTDEYGEESSPYPISHTWVQQKTYNVPENVIASTVLSEAQKTGLAPTQAQFTEEQLKLPVVVELMNDPNVRMVILTGYFLQTDKAEEPVVLHQTLTPINKI